MVPTIGVVVIGLACLLAGFAFGTWFAGSSKGAAGKKAENTQRAFDEYKEAVNHHFGDTAKHFATIGKEYQALYAHMAKGAESLLGADSSLSQEGFPRLRIEPVVAATATVAASDTSPSDTDTASVASANASAGNDETQPTSNEQDASATRDTEHPTSNTSNSEAVADGSSATDSSAGDASAADSNGDSDSDSDSDNPIIAGESVQTKPESIAAADGDKNQSNAETDGAQRSG
ncbi:MAG: DUF1043 family protein [Pseudomonadota bacterium]